MAKRDHTPPYEIMRSRGGANGGPAGAAGGPSTPGGDPSANDPQAASGGDEGVAATSRPTGPSRAPWWVGSSSPLVLRVPRGLAVLALLGVLLVIVVAYWVGSMRGAASATPEPDQPGLGERDGPDGYYVSPDADYQGPKVDVPEDALTQERREKGLNYMQLITSSREDCERIAAFFAKAGVAIQLVPVNNKELWVAYAVKRGYRGDELSSDSCKRYERELKLLGQKWKIHNGGRGTDLSTMIFKKYNG